MPDAVIYFTTSRVAEVRQAAREAARSWQAAHASSLAWCYRVSAGIPEPPHPRCAALLVRAPRAALDAVPPPLRAVEIPTLVPRPMKAAIVRNIAYDRRGIMTRGLSHFAPGTLVYVAGPHSGDGYERTFMIGRDRETARYISMLGATARLKQWHATEVTEPEALFVLRNAYGNWDYERSPELARLPSTPPPIAWQPPAAWPELVGRWFEPERPRLAECTAAVLDCEIAQARTWIEQATLGPELIAAQKGRYRPGAAAVVRSATAAWQAIAPPAWQSAEQARVFARPDLSAPRAKPTEYATRPVPGDLHAVVAFCSAPAGIAEAEALAGELVAMLPPPARAAAGPEARAPRVVWHFIWRSEVNHLLSGPPRAERQDSDATANRDVTASRGALLDALRALTLAIASDDDIAAHDLVSALRGDATASPRHPAATMIDLIALGYVLLDVTDDGTAHLACPRLSAGPRRE